MSIRAYRINNINFEKGESFNLSHDENLVDSLADFGLYNNLNCDGSGIIEFSISMLREALKGKGVEKEAKKRMKEDIKWAKERKEEYIKYYCF